MPQNRSLIFLLDARIRDRKKSHRLAISRHYDSGMAIDLRYDSGFYAPSGAGKSLSLPAGSAPSGAYTVESFDENEAEDASPWGTGELEEASATAASKGGSEASGGAVINTSALMMEDGEGVPVWGTGQLEDPVVVMAASLSEEPDARVWGVGELEALDTPTQAASISDDTNSESPVWGTGQLEDVDASGGVLPSAATFVSPNAAALARKINEEHLLQSHDPDTRAFAQDVEAILAGKKDHPSTTGNTGMHHDNSNKSDEEPQPPASTGSAYASGFSHGVFDQMGTNMSMAKTFDLGSYDLSRQFDVFDRQIDSQERVSERKRQHKPTQTQLLSAQEEFAHDIASMSRTSTPAPARSLNTTASIDLRFDVPLVPQQTGYSCWAAGCAMLVGWRDKISIEPQEIARATGGWAAYANGLNPEDASVFPVWGMTAESAQCYTVEGFYNLLNTYGPLWVASAEPGAHIRVVTGMSGDGSPDGTTLYVNDPWEANMTAFRLPNAGSTTSETYTQFVRKQEELARRELNNSGAIYVAHIGAMRQR